MNETGKLQEEVQIIQAQLGSEAAFERLMERYHGKLTYYLRRLVGDPEKAKDALQSVWLTAYRELPKLRHTQAFSVWLYRIARSQGVKLLQVEQRYVPMEEEMLDVPADEDSITFPVNDAALVHAALEKLRPEHKEVLALRFLEEMTYQQIAEVVGCNTGTVRSRLYYAKEHLRNQLEEMNHGPTQ